MERSNIKFPSATFLFIIFKWAKRLVKKSRFCNFIYMERNTGQSNTGFKDSSIGNLK